MRLDRGHVAGLECGSIHLVPSPVLFPLLLSHLLGKQLSSLNGDSQQAPVNSAIGVAQSVPPTLGDTIPAPDHHCLHPPHFDIRALEPLILREKHR